MKSWPSYLIFETEEQTINTIQQIKTISLTNNPFIRKYNIAKKSLTAEIAMHKGDYHEDIFNKNNYCKCSCLYIF